MFLSLLASLYSLVLIALTATYLWNIYLVSLGMPFINFFQSMGIYLIVLVFMGSRGFIRLDFKSVLDEKQFSEGFDSENPFDDRNEFKKAHLRYLSIQEIVITTYLCLFAFVLGYLGTYFL